MNEQKARRVMELHGVEVLGSTLNTITVLECWSRLDERGTPYFGETPKTLPLNRSAIRAFLGY